MIRKEELVNLDPSCRIDVPTSDKGTKVGTEILFECLKRDIFLVRLKQMIWEAVKEKHLTGKSYSHGKHFELKKMLEENGLKELVSGIIMKIYESVLANPVQNTPHARTSKHEKVSYIQTARINWEKGILEELNAIILETKRPFAIARSPKEPNPHLEKNQSQNTSKDAIKFLFDSEDLLETILAIKNPLFQSIIKPVHIGIIDPSVNKLDIDKIIRRFPELQQSTSQIGVDDLHTAAHGTKFMALRHEEGELLLANSTNSMYSMLEARKYMRRGVPPSLRQRIWRVAVGLPQYGTLVEEQRWQMARQECDRLDLATDELLMHDIQTVIDDPRFFVFEDELKEVILAFSRDEWVRYNSVYEVHAPLLNQLGDAVNGSFMFLGRSNDYSKVAVPPCAVQPFLGLATYFAPLCYIFRSKSGIYHVSRYLFARLWCKLNVISSDEGTLLPLCALFESMLMQMHPRLFLHLVNLGVQPLKIAFPWIHLGFIGFLEVDQILHLWERAIGYMDTTLFVVAAVAIFLHRSNMLLRCDSEVDILNIMMEGSRIHIIALLQGIILKDSKDNR